MPSQEAVHVASLIACIAISPGKRSEPQESGDFTLWQNSFGAGMCRSEDCQDDMHPQRVPVAADGVNWTRRYPQTQTFFGCNLSRQSVSASVCLFAERALVEICRDHDGTTSKA